jgi:hypothetical protein
VTYSTTKAQSGRGTQLSIGTGTPVLIGEIRSLNQSGNTWETADVTNFQSGITKEFILTILDSGEFEVTCNRVSSDTGQQAVVAAFNGTNAAVLEPFTITLLKSGSQTTSGDSIAFNAYVLSQNFTIEPTKEITSTWRLKVSGNYTTTIGT